MSRKYGVGLILLTDNITINLNVLLCTYEIREDAMQMADCLSQKTVTGTEEGIVRSLSHD